MSTTRSLTAFVFFGLACLTSGLRIGVDRAPSPYKGWKKDKTTLVCMKKWAKSGWGKSDQYCLVDKDQMIAAHQKGVKTKTYKMTVSTRWGDCESKTNAAHMKLCSLKGKQDVRVSYSSRVYVPKACMAKLNDGSFLPDGKHSVDYFKAAVSAAGCNEIIAQKPEDLGKFAIPPTTTTTTTSTTTTTVATTTASTAAEDDEAEVTTSIEDTAEDEETTSDEPEVTTTEETTEETSVEPEVTTTTEETTEETSVEPEVTTTVEETTEETSVEPEVTTTMEETTEETSVEPEVTTTVEETTEEISVDEPAVQAKSEPQAAVAGEASQDTTTSIEVTTTNTISVEVTTTEDVEDEEDELITATLEPDEVVDKLEVDKDETDKSGKEVESVEWIVPVDNAKQARTPDKAEPEE